MARVPALAIGFGHRSWAPPNRALGDRYPASRMVLLPEPHDAAAERSLAEADLDPEPHRQFQHWFGEAVAAGEPMPWALALASVDAAGAPAVRMMMLEDVDERGFAFQTNLESPKARDFARQPAAALTFFWPRLVRQVRATGTVARLSAAEVAAYYGRAPVGIQAMIRAARQSTVIPDRAALVAAFEAELRAPSADGVPPHWGGYRLHVATIEFWQGRPNWLQDRLRYTRQPDDTWRIERLVP
jgi:pyridoxamine 5'-phosphate oxidase